MLFSEYRDFLRKDLWRYYGRCDTGCFARAFLTCPGFQHTFWMRTARYFGSKRGWTLPLYAVARFALNHYIVKYGIGIGHDTEIGGGLYIGHFGGIVIHSESKIGTNCNVSHGVTVGITCGGRHPGVPVIGDRVYIGPGAKIIGGITIGNDVAIGANCVVTDDVPDHAVVVGIPGRVISSKGSGDYVTRFIF